MPRPSFKVLADLPRSARPSPPRSTSAPPSAACSSTSSRASRRGQRDRRAARGGRRRAHRRSGRRRGMAERRGAPTTSPAKASPARVVESGTPDGRAARSAASRSSSTAPAVLKARRARASSAYVVRAHHGRRTRRWARSGVTLPHRKDRRLRPGRRSSVGIVGAMHRPGHARAPAAWRPERSRLVEENTASSGRS